MISDEMATLQMLPEAWRSAWTLTGSLWPHDVAGGSVAVLIAWHAVLGEQFTGEELRLVLVEMRRNQASEQSRMPELPAVERALWERRREHDRMARPALAAPRAVPMGDERAVESFVASMRTDRARLRTELGDALRKNPMSDAQIAEAHAAIERVGAAEAVAYRITRDGGEQDWGRLLAAAERRAESYADVDAFLAHEHAPVVPESEPEPESGRDLAAGPEPEETYDIEAIATEFVADPAAWPADRRAALPEVVKKQVRAELARRREKANG